MAPRTTTSSSSASRPVRRRVASSPIATQAAAPAPVVTRDRELLRTIGHHAALITMLWVMLFFFSLGGALLLLKHAAQLSQMEGLQMRVEALESRVGRLDSNVLRDAPPDISALVPLINTFNGASGSSTGSAIQPSMPPTEDSSVSSMATSPSGALTRGSLSPKGDKYAGYEEKTRGKIGIAVELLNTTDARKVRYIVIFNPTTESTGAGTEFESQMSARWSDDSTIEYDILVKKSGKWVKETRTVKIFF